jgi:hypothetical protein
MPAKRKPTEDEIRQQAYHFWEADGRPEGRDLDYWLKAMQAADAPRAKRAAAATPRKRSKAA